MTNHPDHRRLEDGTGRHVGRCQQAHVRCRHGIKTLTLRQVIAACSVTYVALTGLSDALAQAPAYRTLRMDAVGCRERQSFLDAMRLNRDEFATLIVRKAGTGECSVFLKDDAIILDQTDLSGALYCLRPRGDARCYWTYRAVVN